MWLLFAVCIWFSAKALQRQSAPANLIFPKNPQAYAYVSMQLQGFTWYDTPLLFIISNGSQAGMSTARL